MKLIGPAHNPRIQKIKIAANFAGVKLETEEFWPKDAPEAQRKEFAAKNPNLKIPVLETEHGSLFESNSILRYIARLSKNGSLYGSSVYEQSVVDQWLDWVISSLEPTVFLVLRPIRGNGEYNKEVFDKSTDSVKEMLKIVEEVLKNTSHLAGNKLTVADIAFAQCLSVLFRYGFDEKARKPFPSVVKLYLTLANDAHFTSVAGRPHLCKFPLKPYTPPVDKNAKKKGAKDEAKPEEKKEEKKEDKKAEKKEAPKKEEKKEKKPAKKDDDDDDEKPKEVKEKNALDSLPPSSFNLFDYKTLIVNAPNKHDAVKTFWEQFDPEGYSIWKIEYEKAEGEGKVVYSTNNLMNGFMQRLEHFRKYAFAVHGVYGDEPNLEIRGVWVWRGKEIPQEMKDHDSYEFHKFIKLDHTKEADRKLLEEFWCGMNEDEDKADGLTARTVKWFK